MYFDYMSNNYSQATLTEPIDSVQLYQNINNGISISIRSTYFNPYCSIMPKNYAVGQLLDFKGGKRL